MVVYFTEQCKQTFDSRVNKSGIFDSNQLLLAKHALGGVVIGGSRILQCRYEFEAQAPERSADSIPRLQRAYGAREFHGLPAGRCAARGHRAAWTVRDAGTALRRLPAQATDVSGQQLHLQFVGKYPPTMTNKVQYYGFRAEYRFLTSKCFH